MNTEPMPELVATLRGVLLGLLEDCFDAGNEEQWSVAVERASEEVLALFTKVAPQVRSPPFEPARYRMPIDRIALTKDLTIHAPEGDTTFTVTTGYFDDGQLGEVFVRQEKQGGWSGALLDAVATVVSIGLQHGIPWETFAAKLAFQRFQPSGLTDDEESSLRIVSSPLDYLARWISTRPVFAGGKEDEDDE